MRLQITLDKTVFDYIIPPVSPCLIGESQSKAVERVKRHIVVASNELIDIWAGYSKNNNYEEEFQYWLFEVENSTTNFKKIKIEGDSKAIDPCSIEERIILETCYRSDNKITIGDFNSNLIGNNLEINFIKKDLFCKSRKIILTMADLENILIRRYQTKELCIFDIYETGITLEVGSDQSSELLGQYLSMFYANADCIIVQDKFLPRDETNRRNFEQYILPHIDKKDCKIEFIISTDDGNKKKKFENFNGYNTIVKCYKESDVHSSFIETDKYKITLGYRFNIFGNKGKTNKEVIRIDRKR